MQAWHIKWRREGDSNPRGAQTPNGFQDRRIQPLCHLSVRCNDSIESSNTVARRAATVGQQIINTVDERFMREALAEARAAAAEGEVPIGAVVAYDGEIIARAHNRRELDEDPSAHAEFSALVAAARALGRWRLTGCTVYVTLEPCLMCAGLMVNARVDRCVYGAADPKGGALGSLYRLNDDARLNHAFLVEAGVLADECSGLLKAFFSRLRDGSREGNEAHDAKRDEVCRRGSCQTEGVPRGAEQPAPRVVLAIDSFKGSVTSEQAERWVAEGIRHVLPAARITCLPIGDGGEGTAEALAAAGPSDSCETAAHDAFGRAVRARYLLLGAGAGKGTAAFIEMATVAGLACSERTDAAALAASTRGVGELVLDAVARGARTVYLGLGGSATSDGGAGFLQALGARLLDAEGREIPAGLAGLERVASIDLAPAVAELAGARLVALSDVTNPLVGRRGALRVFGPQKGLACEEETLATYDRWMIRYGALLDAACRAATEPLFRSLPGVPGAGAAGGLGAAVLALGGTLMPGIDAVLDRAGFNEVLQTCDLVVTGEGLMDDQTAGGKAPLGVARRARAAGVPVVAVVGGRADNLDTVYDQGIDLVLPIVQRPMDLAEALMPEQTRANLVSAGESAARAYLLGRRW